ncbi:MAG TPA: DNRLRE domain-containing protein [archaeon]|nr:DNRLRE domain-containing protein [archaeon]
MKNKRIFYMLFIAVVLPLIFLTQSALGATSTTSVLHDTYVDQGLPSTNFGTENHVKIGSNGQKLGFILFNLTDKPTNYVDAQLILKITTIVTEAVLDVNVYSVPNNSWAETDLTWNNKPSYTELIETFHVDYDELMASTGGYSISINITDYVSGQAVSFAFATNSTESDYCGFTAKDNINLPDSYNPIIQWTISDIVSPTGGDDPPYWRR